MFVFNKAYIESHKNAKGQWDYINGIRKTFASNQEALQHRLAQQGADRSVIAANAGIGMLDFYQDVDKRLVSVRQNTNFAIVKDIESLATPVNIGALTSVNLMAQDISDDVTISMGMGDKINFDSVGSDFDKNPIPVFTGGAGLDFRLYMGQEAAQLGLYAEAIERKSVKVAESIGNYMYNGNVKIGADGVKGEGIKNHRNTSKLNLGAAGYNIDLTSATTTNDELVTFYVQDLGLVIDTNALGSIDVQWVSPEIYRRLMQPVGGTGQFKDGTMRDYLIRASEIKDIQKDYSLVGNEFIMYKRDQQVISPLIALPMTSYQMFRADPYGNYNQKLIAVNGLKIAKTYNNKYGVFYASVVS